MPTKSPNEGPAGGSRHICSLDGLRGVAILLVLAHHVTLRWPETLGPLAVGFRYGWIGVDLFFALSGFLITGTLLSGKSGLAGLKLFYLKRALRIWPMYYVSLVVVCVYACAIHQSYPWAVSLVFVQNFLPAWPTVGFEQTWSLCIEEHFYLVWPLLVLFTPRRLLRWVLLGVLLLSPILRWWAIEHGVSTKLLYSSTQYRLDAIAFGSLIGLLHAHTKQATRYIMHAGAAMSLVGIAWASAAFARDPSDLGQRSVMGYTALALLSAGLILLLVSARSSFASSALSWAPLRFFGKISYGLYMIHPFLLMNVGRLNLSRPWLESSIAVTISIALASVSWSWFEKPIMNLRSRVGHQAAKIPTVDLRAFGTATE